jgi:hypothetical protein
MANAETFKADYPDASYSEAYIQISGKNRQALLLTFKGWAKANAGQVESALADFALADGLVRRTYLGQPENELYLYWGKTLLAQGNAKGAADKLAPAALFGGQKEALDPLKQAYLATGGNESGFEDFIWKQRKLLAKTADDFTLEDYEGQPRRFADLRGKATLLNFWSPT